MKVIDCHMTQLLHSGDFKYNQDATLNKGNIRVIKNSTINYRDVYEYLPCTSWEGTILVPNYTLHTEKKN